MYVYICVCVCVCDSVYVVCACVLCVYAIHVCIGETILNQYASILDYLMMMF